MPTAAFTTLGCKVNQYETQRIQETFERAGFRIVPFTESADVYVINTCSVTGQAESKSRQTIRRAANLNPKAKVVVTGCASQMAINLGKPIEASHVVVPNPEKLDTFSHFKTAFPEIVERASAMRTRLPSAAESRARATVKIQDGCSVHCSYCSIPSTRPGMTSRHHKEIIAEVEALGERGFKEVVLTGVLIGAYGPETGSGGPDFETLVEMLCEIESVSQIRISSIEATQVTDRLVATMTKPATKVVPHLHIPLQAGSDRVLTDMNRPYRKSDYLLLCESLYAEIPDLAITADIMVGFPTETDDDFAHTVDVCEKVRFAKTHIFRFSPRPGTVADKWGDAVSPQEKARRSAVLAEVSSRTRAEFVRRHVGRSLPVLVETKSRTTSLLRGHSANYIEVEFPGPEALIGQLTTVRIVSADATTALGVCA